MLLTLPSTSAYLSSKYRYRNYFFTVTSTSHNSSFRSSNNAKITFYFGRTFGEKRTTIRQRRPPPTSGSDWRVESHTLHYALGKFSHPAVSVKALMNVMLMNKTLPYLSSHCYKNLPSNYLTTAYSKVLKVRCSIYLDRILANMIARERLRSKAGIEETQPTALQSQHILRTGQSFDINS